MLRDLLARTIDLMLDDQRHLLNTAYAKRDCYEPETTEYKAFQREVERRLATVKTLETMLVEAKG